MRVYTGGVELPAHVSDILVGNGNSLLQSRCNWASRDRVSKRLTKNSQLSAGMSFFRECSSSSLLRMMGRSLTTVSNWKSRHKHNPWIIHTHTHIHQQQAFIWCAVSNFVRILTNSIDVNKEKWSEVTCRAGLLIVSSSSRARVATAGLTSSTEARRQQKAWASAYLSKWFFVTAPMSRNRQSTATFSTGNFQSKS